MEVFFSHLCKNKTLSASFCSEYNRRTLKKRRLKAEQTPYPARNENRRILYYSARTRAVFLINLLCRFILYRRKKRSPRNRHLEGTAALLRLKPKPQKPPKTLSPFAPRKNALKRVCFFRIKNRVKILLFPLRSMKKTVRRNAVPNF